MGRILTVKLARQKGRDGISEPEDTLYMFAASMILVPFAMLLYGLGVTYRVHWFALVFSQGALAVSNCLCVAGGIGYAISSYRELSGDMVTTLILIRNTLSFAVNYGYVFFFFLYLASVKREEKKKGSELTSIVSIFPELHPG